MKKTTKMLKGLLLLSLALLMTNCATEEIGQKNVAQSSTEAKIWFDNHQKDYNAPVLNYIGDLQWQNAITSQGDMGEIIEVPFTLTNGLVASTKEADQYNDHHRLMFVKDKQNEFKLSYIQIFANDENYNIQDKNYNYYNIKDNFDGNIYVQELATNIRQKIEFKEGKKIAPSLTAKMREMACLYYGYWDGTGRFNPLYEVACFSGGPTGDSGSSSVPNYGGGVGGGTTPKPSESCPEGYVYKLGECVPNAIPPSCESFNFTSKAGTIWQESAVVNVHFNIVVLDASGVSYGQIIEFPSAILFGTPTNISIGDTQISAGLAATLSARALKVSMDEAVSRYGNQPVSELTVRLYFEERLKYNYPLFIPGGRVNFNASAFSGVPTSYKTNFLGTGNCN